MNGLLVVLSFLGLFMLGFPVVLAIGLPSIAYLLLNDLPLQMVAQRTLYALDSFPLVAVPVFIFVGSLMNGAGISKVIYRFADTAVGRLPGGLAQVNIFGSLVVGTARLPARSVLADAGAFVGRFSAGSARPDGPGDFDRRQAGLHQPKSPRSPWPTPSWSARCFTAN